ncbi:MAG: dienelactone hydrolase family protein [Burkholderiales bacterium]
MKKTDPRIKAGYMDYDSASGSGKMRGYMAQPAKASGKLPAILVIHENRGLNPYIEDVARRLALANFVAFAPDALFPQGGYPGDEDKGRAMFAAQDAKKRSEDLYNGGLFLKSRPETTGKMGVVGFCFGGSVSNALAVRMPDLAAAVPYYGSQAKAEDVPKIQAPLLLHYASLDDRINKGWPAYEEALKAHKKTYTVHFTKVPTTASTTTLRRVTTRRRRSCRGSVRWSSSTNTCAAEVRIMRGACGRPRLMSRVTRVIVTRLARPWTKPHYGMPCRPGCCGSWSARVCWYPCRRSAPPARSRWRGPRIIRCALSASSSPPRPDPPMKFSRARWARTSKPSTASAWSSTAGPVPAA